VCLTGLAEVQSGGNSGLEKKNLLHEPHKKAAVYQLCNTEKQRDNSTNEPPILKWPYKTKQMAFGNQTKDGKRRHQEYFNWGWVGVRE